MHADPDDPTLLHSHFALRAPTLVIATLPGRFLLRRVLRRMAENELRATGFTLTGPYCFHFGSTDGAAVAFVHFTCRDQLAADFAGETAR
ncbi:hypothetical protein GCM10009592_26890 [Brachybacterium rhamnosum]|uniref:Uncharacterized protein n=1 Tax=Brachybacterium rhamnosum TaxID=173361 RepID=A0ABW4PZJ8_9MICO